MSKVIRPVRVNEKGEVLEAPYIITDETRKGDAVDFARKYSGLGRFDSWHFLSYGELDRSGTLSVNDTYHLTINQLIQRSFNKRNNGRN